MYLRRSTALGQHGVVVCSGPAPAAMMPGFDEYMLGYADRSAALPAEHADRIVPGGNGVFQPTVVNAGQVVGTWRAAGKAGRREVAATPFTAFTRSVAAAIPKRYAAGPYPR